MPPMDVYVEAGSKRTFAGSLEWPGWCRSGRDEPSALEALLSYAPRYVVALKGTRLGFEALGDLRVVERLRGDATTDFGAPGIAPSADAEPMTEADLRRAQTVFRACWRAFDAAADEATDKELRKGPRGGGRELDGIVEHVVGSDAGYLRMIGAKPGREQEAGPEPMREAILAGLAAAVRDGVPPSPRGGKRWTPRYFLRRSAWHVLDHAWEIEDRTPG
jgi:hypothetical protein